MKDWTADYQRHVSLGFSIGNIKGFSDQERTLYITHGYGQYFPVQAREVFVRDERCFGVDWVENNQTEFGVNTAKLSVGPDGISPGVLSDYLDLHLDRGFESFVDNYFEGTPFITQILKTAHRFWLREKTPVIRKALKFVLAYNLTQHVTMVLGIGEEEDFEGKIDAESSRYNGQTVAPVMINFQVKCGFADMWRALQKDILEELSTLYSSVYTKEKLKHWPTIFLLACILLAVWEEMQWDCRYRVPVSLTEEMPSGVLAHRTRMLPWSRSSAMTWKPLQLASSPDCSVPSPRSYLLLGSGRQKSIMLFLAPMLLSAPPWRRFAKTSIIMVRSHTTSMPPTSADVLQINTCGLAPPPLSIVTISILFPTSSSQSSSSRPTESLPTSYPSSITNDFTTTTSHAIHHGPSYVLYAS